LAEIANRSYQSGAFAHDIDPTLASFALADE
jgi:hypothetical protein